MATVKTPAKKTPAKKVVAKKAAPKKVLVTGHEQTFNMPLEVKEWIDRASSTMKHQANQIAELKKEVMDLKAYKKFAANKIQGMSYE